MGCYQAWRAFFCTSGMVHGLWFPWIPLRALSRLKLTQLASKLSVPHPMDKRRAMQHVLQQPAKYLRKKLFDVVHTLQGRCPPHIRIAAFAALAGNALTNS